MSQDGGVRDGEVPEPDPDGGPNGDAGPEDGGSIGNDCPSAPVFSGAMLRICIPFGGLSFANNGGEAALLSHNGRYVVFVPTGDVPHLVADDANGQGDLIRVDLQTGAAAVLSRGVGGAQSDHGATDITGLARDGSRVVFRSSSTNLAANDDNGQSRDSFVWTEGSGTLVRYSETQFHAASLQFMGDTVWPRVFAFTSDPNVAVLDFQEAGNNGQVVMFNFTTRQMELISKSAITAGQPASGDSANGDVSADRRWAAFSSNARDLITGYVGPAVRHVYRFDRNTGAVTRISVNRVGLEASDPSRSPSVANDGKVAFETDSDFITDGDTNGESDIVVYDGGANGPRLVSVSSTGEHANNRSVVPQISANGRFVVFTSYATNLVPDDTNGVGDVFVHDLSDGRTARVSGNGDGGSRGAQISEDGSVIMFISSANNLVPGDGETVGLEIFVARNPLLP